MVSRSEKNNIVSFFCLFIRKNLTYLFVGELFRRFISNLDDPDHGYKRYVNLVRSMEDLRRIVTDLPIYGEHLLKTVVGNDMEFKRIFSSVRMVSLFLHFHSVYSDMLVGRVLEFGSTMINSSYEICSLAEASKKHKPELLKLILQDEELFDSIFQRSSDLTSLEEHFKSDIVLIARKVMQNDQVFMRMRLCTLKMMRNNTDIVVSGILLPNGQGGFCDTAKSLMLQEPSNLASLLNFVVDVIAILKFSFSKISNPFPTELILIIMDFVLPQNLDKARKKAQEIMKK